MHNTLALGILNSERQGASLVPVKPAPNMGNSCSLYRPHSKLLIPSMLCLGLLCIFRQSLCNKLEYAVESNNCIAEMRLHY